MKPSNAFMRLLPGALEVCGYRSTSGKTAQQFWRAVNACQTVEEIVRLVQGLDESKKTGVDVRAISITGIVLQRGKVTINLKQLVRPETDCLLEVRIREQPKGVNVEAELQLTFVGSGKLVLAPNAGGALRAFIDKANKAGKSEEAGQILAWLREFGAAPSEAVPKLKKAEAPGVGAVA